MTTADGPLVLAIDVGGTWCAAAVLDVNERILSQNRWPSEVEKGSQNMIRRMTDEARKLLGRHKGKLAGTGVGCGGPLDRHSGIVLGPPNLPGWDRVSLTARLTANLSAPAWLDNDANLGALGEYRHGAGRGAVSLAYVTLSTGIGAGLIINGQPFYGAGDGAGELGHQTILPNGPRCPCGNLGCLEMLASGSAIGRRARAAVEADPTGARYLLALVGQDVKALTARHVAEAVRARDPFATRLWHETIDYLGIGIGNLMSILSPHRVVVGGGVADAGDILFHPLRDALKARARMVASDQFEVLPAGLGNDSVLYGAAAMALQCVAEKRPISPRAKVGRRTTGDLRRVREV